MFSNKGPASPKSPSGQQQKKGKQGTKWQDDVDINSLNYGESQAGSENTGVSASASSEDLTSAYQYLSVSRRFKL